MTLGFFGIGLLALPFAFRYVGIVGGSILICIVAATTLYCFNVLVETKRFYHSKGRTSVNSYAEVGFEAFGRLGSSLVNIAIIANQVGVISAYQQFIGKTIAAIYPSVLGRVSLPGWVMLWCVVLVPLCWVRQLKWFSFTSIFGLFSMLFTVVAVIVNGALHSTPLDPLPLWPSDLFLFLGIAAFGYAGIAISISVENSMRNPDDFLKMISATFAVVTVVYIGFGTVNFWLYGDSAQAVISCVVNGPLGDAVKAALIIQLTFALPLNTHPIWTTVEPPIEARLVAHNVSTRARFWIFNLIRAVAVVLMGVLAFAIPYFGDFSNLVGAIATSFVTWILPPALQLKAFGRSLPLRSYLLNVACLTFGLAVMVASSTVTVMNLVSEIENPVPPAAGTC